MVKALQARACFCVLLGGLCCDDAPLQHATQRCSYILPIAQVGYPERLGFAVFLGAPRVFGLLWKAVRVLLDARTVSKVHFCNACNEMEQLVGLRALPPELGGADTAVDAHMARWCASLQDAQAGKGAAMGAAPQKSGAAVAAVAA